MPDQQSIKKQIGEDILHQFSKSVITLLGTKKRRSATAPRCMWQLDSYDALRSHLNDFKRHITDVSDPCRVLLRQPEGWKHSFLWVRILWVDLRYDSWHNSKIAPRCIQLLIDLIDSNHDSWLTKLTYKMICSKHHLAGLRGFCQVTNNQLPPCVLPLQCLWALPIGGHQSLPHPRYRWRTCAISPSPKKKTLTQEWMVLNCVCNKYHKLILICIYIYINKTQAKWCQVLSLKSFGLFTWRMS